MRNSDLDAAELEQLFPRQRALVRVIHECGGGITARQVHARIPDPPPSHDGVKTLLNRMVRKGLLRSRRSGRHREVVYLPAKFDARVQLKAFQRVADEHFEGSSILAARALASLAECAARDGDVASDQDRLQAA